MVGLSAEQNAGQDGRGLVSAEAENYGGVGFGEFAFEVLTGGARAFDYAGFVGPAFAAAVCGVYEGGDFGELVGLGVGYEQFLVWRILRVKRRSPMSIEVSHEVGVRISDEASRQGISVDELLQRLMDDRQVAPSGKSSKGLKLPRLRLGDVGELHRRDIYDDAD
jgi:hypothetical protein